jgi:hypothetical protein
MARNEARLQIDLWQEGLDGLGPHAKLMYCVLLTEPTVNHAGVGAWRQSRWARNASLTAAETAKALDELIDGDFVLIDTDKEEFLVRTLIRNDGVADQPYVLKGALAAALGVKSKRIRWVLAQELRKLPPKRPNGKSKSGKTVVYPDPHGVADVLDPPGSPAPRDPHERVSKGSQDPPETHPTEKGFETQSSDSGVGEGVGEVVISSPVVTSVGAAKTRGSRIPEDFKVTPDMVEWARRECPLVDGRFHTQQFIDYWMAQPGKSAVKLDWKRTWQRWMRKEQNDLARRPGAHLRSVPTYTSNDPETAYAQLLAQADAREAARLIGGSWADDAKPPSDPTPYSEWMQARRREFIAANADRIRAALTERRTG